ncbi:MAG: 3-phosphoshikimate 1-carboxyvinyltransferase [Actinomycetaceae bacterium]|nr:3-phosphoshikimate 1-carboxyvinyltransferase [Actinomycetaceae bacterium]
MTVNESVSAGAGVFTPVPAESTSAPSSQTSPHEYWEAPLAPDLAYESEPLQIPGSKSQTNRALLLASLSNSPSRIVNPLWARDTLLMKAGLEQLGAKFTEVSANVIEVTPLSLSKLTQPVTIDCGLAGTVMRFLPVVAAALATPVTFTADPQANQRPLQPLLAVLTSLGAEVKYHGEATFPFTIRGPLKHFPTEIEVDATSSSQFFSALLLVLPWAYPAGRLVTIRSTLPPSTPHILMSVAELAAYGIAASLEPLPRESAPETAPQLSLASALQPTQAAASKTLAVRLQTACPVPVQPTRRIEVDTTTAMVFIAAAAFTKAPVRIANWPKESAQPGAGFLQILRQLGVVTYFEEAADGTTTLLALPADLTCTPPEKPFDLSDFGELTPVAVGLATQAPVPVTFTGIKHLRGHETDRLAALATELAKLGIPCQVKDDSLTVFPRESEKHPQKSKLAPAVSAPETHNLPVLLHTYHDHRLAMLAALLGLKYPILVENVATVAKTLPNFVQLWESLILGKPTPATARGAIANTYRVAPPENCHETPVRTDKGGSVEPA